MSEVLVDLIHERQRPYCHWTPEDIREKQVKKNIKGKTARKYYVAEEKKIWVSAKKFMQGNMLVDKSERVRT